MEVGGALCGPLVRVYACRPPRLSFPTPTRHCVLCRPYPPPPSSQLLKSSYLPRASWRGCRSASVKVDYEVHQNYLVIASPSHLPFPPACVSPATGPDVPGAPPLPLSYPNPVHQGRWCGRKSRRCRRVRARPTIARNKMQKEGGAVHLAKRCGGYHRRCCASLAPSSPSPTRVRGPLTYPCPPPSHTGCAHHIFRSCPHTHLHGDTDNTQLS